MAHFLSAVKVSNVAPMIAALCLIFVAWRWPAFGSETFKRIELRLQALARRRVLTAVLLVAFPILARLALLPADGVPIPFVHDEFGYLLVADTMLHGRLANPPHADPEFFEALYIIRAPTYSSYYPIGIGVTLAIGRVLFGHPWGGVLLFSGLMCAGVYWMLLAWVTPGWALLGGFLAAINVSVLTDWGNGYWGGCAAAVAGCLIFGAAPRLIDKSDSRNGLLAGLGVSFLALIRPFEAALTYICLLFFALLYRSVTFRRSFWPTALLFALGLAPGVMVTALHDHAVTGSWTKLPYQLYREQYGVPQTFNFQPAAVPRHALTPTQAFNYEWQTKLHRRVAGFSGWIGNFPARLDTIHFFIGAALVPVLLLLPFALRGPRIWWVIAVFGITFLGESMYGFFSTHYVAHLIGLFMLLAILCLQRMQAFPWGQTAVRLLITLSIFSFVLLYAMYAAEPLLPAAIRNSPALEKQMPPLITHTGRRMVMDRLAKQGGQHLIFVTYPARYRIQFEWIYNGANIDASPVVWARDLGPAKDKLLMSYYPGRTVWEMDAPKDPFRMPELKQLPR